MQIHESKDFSMWLDTMEADFGGRFMKLFRGPMWSGQPRECWNNPEFARINIASTSKRQHQNKERNSGFSTVPGLQVVNSLSDKLIDHRVRISIFKVVRKKVQFLSTMKKLFKTDRVSCPAFLQ